MICGCGRRPARTTCGGATADCACACAWMLSVRRCVRVCNCDGVSGRWEGRRRVNGVGRRMRETPLRWACPPPAGRYYPNANGSLWPPLSFVNDASSSSSATIQRRENRLWCSALSLVLMAAVLYDRSSPPYRHNIPRSACRLRTAAVRLRRLCGRRSAGQPSSHRFASASGRSSAAAERLLHYPCAVHTRRNRRCRRGFPIYATAMIAVRKILRFTSTPIRSVGS